MIALNISDRERGALYLVFSAGPSWGGSVEALLLRDAVYSELGLDEFETKTTPLKDMPGIPSRSYQLPRDAVEHIVASVAANGMVRDLARILAPLVRRARPVLAVQEKKSALVSVPSEPDGDPLTS
jgi:hypothetical protein